MAKKISPPDGDKRCFAFPEDATSGGAGILRRRHEFQPRGGTSAAFHDNGSGEDFKESAISRLRQSAEYPFLKTAHYLFRNLPVPVSVRLLIRDTIFGIVNVTGSVFRYARGTPNPASGVPSLLQDPYRIPRAAEAARKAVNRAPPLDFDLDISLVTFNSGRWLAEFFESLLHQQYPTGRIGLLIIDHGSSDDTQALIDAFQDENAGEFRKIIVRRQSNLGFGAGHNRNLEISDAPFFLVSNPDVTFESDSLPIAVRTAMSDTSEIAAWELRQKPYEHPKYYDPVTLETAWCSAACLLLRTEYIQRVGGFDEAIFMYGEDVELSYRLRDAGYRLKYCPRASVWHYTYEQAGERKPLQIAGAVFSAAALRLRYGGIKDKLAIAGLFGRVFLSGTGFPAGRRLVLKQAVQILRKARYFLSTRKQSDIRFGFRGLNYEMAREGAFYKSLPDDDATRPLVSIIMRTCAGRLGYLQEAVQTVVNQTYQLIELIVIEDGSNGAEHYVSALQETPTLQVHYRSIPKSGRSACGNAGLELATGEFLMFLDDDDGLFADHVETLSHTLVTNPHAPAAYSYAWQVVTRIQFSNQPLYIESGFRVIRAHRRSFNKKYLQIANLMPIQSVMFRRVLIETYGGLKTELDALEDWNLWIRFSQAGDFVCIPKTTSFYRVPSKTFGTERRATLFQEYYSLARVLR